jgi:hypothetical protein
MGASSKLQKENPEIFKAVDQAVSAQRSGAGEE